MMSVTSGKLNRFIIGMFSMLNICLLVIHIDALTHLRISIACMVLLRLWFTHQATFIYCS